MNSTSITFASPWLLLLLIPALFVILFPYLRLPKEKRRSLKKIIPVILHCLIALFLVLIIAGLSFVTHTTDEAVVIVVDYSFSTRDSHELIAEYANEIQDTVSENAPVAVVAFGAENETIVDFDSLFRDIAPEKIDDSASDIASALEYAASLLPGDKAGRIILLSDGSETDGNADDEARLLASRGIHLDCMYFESTALEGNEVQITSFTVPDTVYAEDSATLSVTIDSNVETEINVNFYEKGLLSSDRKMNVSVGTNVITYTVDNMRTGGHFYTATLTVDDPSADTMEENNVMYAYCEARGDPRLLIIGGSTSESRTMRKMLESIGVEAEITSLFAEKAPSTLVELCKYDEIIIKNVNALNFADGFEEMLDKYVSVYGKSVIYVGGNSTFKYGQMEDTKFEEMMPVSFDCEESDDAPSVALCLVLDCSSSMANNEGGKFLSVSKQGAINCVESLTDNDFVGVISFNYDAYIDSELVPATDENKQTVGRIIASLKTATCTYYKKALECARDMLKESTADKKHIIFLSDGEPSDGRYLPVIEQMYKDYGITTSTIGLKYFGSCLPNMAVKGNGRYYYVDNSDDIPDIMLTETKQIEVDSLKRGDFTANIDIPNDVTLSYSNEELPPLSGYLATTLKEDAVQYMSVDGGQPLYATHKYGIGTVSVFTSDLDENWSPLWLTGEIGKTVVKNMMSTTMSDARSSSSLFVSFTPRGKSSDVVVQTPLADSGERITAVFSSEEGDEEYQLKKIGKGLFEGSIDTKETGMHMLIISDRDSEDNVIDTYQITYPVNYSCEYDINAPGNASSDFLTGLVSYSGGMMIDDDNIGSLADAETTEMNIVYSPLIPLGIATLILLLSDIAIRKIRWKDLKKYFENIITRFKKKKT